MSKYQHTDSGGPEMVIIHSYFLQLSTWKPKRRYGQKAGGLVFRSLTLHLWSGNHGCNALQALVEINKCTFFKQKYVHLLTFKVNLSFRLWLSTCKVVWNASDFVLLFPLLYGLFFNKGIYFGVRPSRLSICSQLAWAGTLSNGEGEKRLLLSWAVYFFLELIL